MTVTIKLGTNKSTEWVLARMTRLAKSASSKQLLGMYQACALYYVCNGVKRDEAMDVHERNKQSAIRYRDFIVPAFLRFLVEEAGHALPSWLTKSFMGKSTMNAKTEAFYDVKLSSHWHKYEEAGREIRSTITPIAIRLLGPAGATREAQLPSGTQAEDIMDELNRELWFLSAGGTRVVSREELLNLKASGADVVVVEKERGGNAGGGGPDPAGGKESGAEDGKEEVRVCMPMPKDWTHQHLLTFAFFGKLAAKEYRCPDLEPGEGGGNGPVNKKRPKKQRAEDLGEADDDRTDDTTSSTSSDLSGRGIRLMTAAGKTQSRGRKRAAVPKDHQAQANQGYKRQMLEMLGKIQDDSNSRRLVDLVEAIAQRVKDEAALHMRQNDISAVKGEIEIYKDVGDTEKLKDARTRLLDLYKKPVVVGIPVAPVPVGGDDGNRGQELDGDGNGGQESGGGGGDREDFVGVGGGDREEFFGVGGENNSDSEEEVAVVVG